MDRLGETRSSVFTAASTVTQERDGAATTLSAPSSLAPEPRDAWFGLKSWPKSALIYGVLLAAIYAPHIRDTWSIWLTDDKFTFAFLIVPLAAYFVWLRRKEIAVVKIEPEPVGLGILLFGVWVAVAAYLLNIKYIGFASLPISLAGLVLFLHGRGLLRLTRYPIALLLFACPLAGTLTRPLSGWVQRLSTDGTSIAMSVLGYPLVQLGNYIELANGTTLEVADVCSGFNKLLAMAAFAFTFGYFYNLTIRQRLLLLAATAPIAIAANILRLCVLVAVSAKLGKTGLEMAHNAAEYLVLAISFALFMPIGKWIGCTKRRF